MTKKRARIRPRGGGRSSADTNPLVQRGSASKSKRAVSRPSSMPRQDPPSLSPESQADPGANLRRAPAPTRSGWPDEEDDEDEVVLPAPTRGKGNRPGWKSWIPNTGIEEHNCPELIERAHPVPLPTITADAAFMTQGYVAEPSFEFRLVRVEPLTAEALAKVHPCLLYRLLPHRPAESRRNVGHLTRAVHHARR
jgi:hypothetical protein